MKGLVFSLLILFSANLFGQNYKTKAELTDYKETDNYTETIDYCISLDSASDLINYFVIGESAAGRDIPALIVDKDGLSDPESIKQAGRAILLVEASIHSGETDGKDALVMLVRDIAVNGKYKDLLENVSLLAVPVFNADGLARFGKYHRINQNGPEVAGWRTTATNLDLNRDFLKADSPEMRSMIKLFVEWLPDFFIDCHTTDGADYQYTMTYIVQNLGGIEQSIADWMTNEYLVELDTKMTESGYLMYPYVTFRNWHDPRSGLARGVGGPRYSIGYAAAQNRPGLLAETHMLKDYKSRVLSTYELIRHTLQIMNEDKEQLINMNKNADIYTESEDFRSEPFPLKYKTSFEDSTFVDFKGVKYQSVESDLTGGEWFIYSDEPETMKLPFFDKVSVEKQVNLPEAYIISPEWSEVIERLEIHGIEYMTLAEDTEFEIETYKLTDQEFSKAPYQGRMTATFTTQPIIIKKTYPIGSAIVDMQQRNARVIANIFEPDAYDSYAHWGFFNTIFERTEYVESYVMERMARQMLEEDPNLRDEFEERMKNASESEKTQRSILYWFYEKTPYYDQNYQLYPVGKIYDRSLLENLRLR